MYRTQQEWLERNPLRVWRLSQPRPLCRNETAELLDVSRMSLSNWERGIWPPNEIGMEMLMRICGISRSHWDAWLANRPQEAQETQPANK